MERPIFPEHMFAEDFEYIYEPQEDTYALIDSVAQDIQLIKDYDPLVCLEVGCGSGAAITSLAKCLGPTTRLYLATDFNPRALTTTQKCCQVNGITDCTVQLVRNDLTQAIQTRLKHSVDLILFNSPYRRSEPAQVC
ncbi:unnamed protein product, partial [Oppiella nova]